MEDVSLPDPPPAETTLEDSAVEPDLQPQQPPETTYHLVQEGTIRGKTKFKKVQASSQKNIVIESHQSY